MLFSGSVFSKKVDQDKLVFLRSRSGKSLKFAPCDYPNECLEKAITLSQAFSSKKLYAFPEGFGLALISYPAPAFKKAPTSLLVNFLAVSKILKQIISKNVILSFSNKPRLTYL